MCGTKKQNPLKKTPWKQRCFNPLNIMLSKSWLILLFLWTAQIHAQELVLPIHQNQDKSPELLKEHQRTSQTRSDALDLPFRDDFTNDGPYPDPGKWIDQYVFVNTGFPVHPKTYGVATFDILDEHGDIYDHATMDNIPFAADHLTSDTISLSAYNPSDSLILSFYYQPQGRGAPPAANDSLVLQFRLPPHTNDNGNSGDNGNGSDNGDNGDDDNDGDNDNDNDNGENDDEDHLWQSVWKATGESLQSFSQDTFPYFKRVAIPITDEQFFHEAFQFRYKNYASFSPGQTIPNNTQTGNIWNIDYVYLDSNRSLPDSTYYDIAFVSPAQSLLQDLTAMPWSHYIADPQQVLRSHFQVLISNLDDAAYNYTYRYIIQDEGQHTIRTYSGGSDVIQPFYEQGYQNYPPHSNPIVLANPLPVDPADERRFRIIHQLQAGSDGDDFPRNDTIAFEQVFSDYFSYDDGSPELIHLVKGSNPGRALQFHAAHTDTIEAVKIFMLETINNQDLQQGYEIFIWDSLDPENIVYQSEEQFITDDEEGTRGAFEDYQLTDPVTVEGTFYVGFRQTGNVLLSNAIVVGFDKSNNVSHRLYYDSGDGWFSSGVSGALMIRPVVKRDLETGITAPDGLTDASLTVYPNPASGDVLHMETDKAFGEGDTSIIQIFDARGRMLHQEKLSPSVNIASLQNGVYLLRVTDTQSGHSVTKRIIVAR